MGRTYAAPLVIDSAPSHEFDAMAVLSVRHGGRPGEAWVELGSTTITAAAPRDEVADEVDAARLDAWLEHGGDEPQPPPVPRSACG